jgi:hypothetical protein
MHKLVRKMLEKAKLQESEAYKALGAEPGPGLDLEIFPEQPMQGLWYCNGLTEAGRRFVTKFYMEQPFNNYILARLKREAEEWAMKYRIVLPILSLTEAALKGKE